MKCTSLVIIKEKGLNKVRRNKTKYLKKQKHFVVINIVIIFTHTAVEWVKVMNSSYGWVLQKA